LADLPIFLLALVAVIAIPFMLDWTFGDGSNGDSITFKLHRSDLAGTELAWNSADHPQQFWLTGYLTNAGSYAWRIQELEIRIKSGPSNLVDVAHVALAKEESFVVLPGREHALSVRFTSFVLATNSTLTLRVQRATDGRNHYEPFDTGL